MDRKNRVAAERVRGVIDRLVRTKSATDSDGLERPIFPVALPLTEAEALRDWVCREKAARTVEVGLAFAFSALHICEGLIRNGDPEAKHVTMDPHQTTGYSRVGLNVLGEAGVDDLVEHHDEESQILLPRFVKEGRSFDFAFIDGNHRFDAVFVDMFFLGKIVRMGGVVALDDYELPGIHRAVSFFTSNLGWRILESINNRLVVLRTATEPDARDFRFFVEF